MLSILLLVASVGARLPTQAQLACDDCAKALLWINGAQDAALLALQTLLGGYNCAGATIAACFEHVEQMSATTCIGTESPDACLGCNLTDQITLEDECCDVPATESGAPPHVDDGAVCRTNRQWLAIGFAKLAAAYDAYDECTSETAATALTLACAAERIISRVLVSLNSEFLAIDATYRHITSAKTRATFACDGGTSLDVLVRTVQSFRACSASGACPAHALVATYSQFQIAPGATLGPGTHQLLWPIGGTVSAFDRTGLPRDAHCSLAAAESTADPAHDFRLPTLGRLDFARVVEGFTRCDGLPRNGQVRSFFDLSAERCCNTLPLVADLGAAARLRRHDTDPTVFALAYVAHFDSAVTYESAPDRDVAVHEDLLVRTAAADVCVDCAPAGFATLAVAAPTGAPVFGPRDSMCVGGPASGRSCSGPNECGAGLACTVQPGDGRALCFDGAWWNTAMPCALDAQCPYGECYGAVRGGIVDGALPYAFIWAENACDDPARATSLCTDAQLREWRRANE